MVIHEIERQERDILVSDMLYHEILKTLETKNKVHKRFGHWNRKFIVGLGKLPGSPPTPIPPLISAGVGAASPPGGVTETQLPPLPSAAAAAAGGGISLTGQQKVLYALPAKRKKRADVSHVYFNIFIFIIYHAQPC